MTDETAAPKTKTLGSIDATKAKKIPGFADYVQAAAKLMEARNAASLAKTKVKEAMKKSLKEDGEIDFTIESSGTVRVFKNLVEKKARVVQGADLSNHF